MEKKHNNFFEQYRKKCEKSNHGKKVIIPANDPLNGQCGDKIDILFVNERPGPTALKTGFISFENPDESARRFKRLFEKTFGLKYRKKVFITNAVLWCPKVRGYKNTTPTLIEIKNASEVLSSQIKKIKPKIIVTMGKSALKALYYSFKESGDVSHLKTIKLKSVAGKIITKIPHKIVPLFHTSPLGKRNRSETEQLKDWKKMKNILLYIKNETAF